MSNVAKESLGFSPRRDNVIRTDRLPQLADPASIEQAIKKALETPRSTSLATDTWLIGIAANYRKAPGAKFLPPSIILPLLEAEKTYSKQGHRSTFSMVGEQSFLGLIYGVDRYDITLWWDIFTRGLSEVYVNSNISAGAIRTDPAITKSVKELVMKVNSLRSIARDIGKKSGKKELFISRR